MGSGTVVYFVPAGSEHEMVLDESHDFSFLSAPLSMLSHLIEEATQCQSELNGDGCYISASGCVATSSIELMHLCEERQRSKTNQVQIHGEANILCFEYRCPSI